MFDPALVGSPNFTRSKVILNTPVIIFLLKSIFFAIIRRMKSKVVKHEKSQIELEIICSAMAAQPIADRIIEKYNQEVEIKGFRKGKAPKIMVIEKVGFGKIQQEIINAVVENGYLHSIKEHKFHPISQPSIAINKYSIKPDGVVEKDIEFSLRVDTMPKIKLGDYTKIKIKDKKILEKDVSVSKDEVDKVLKHLRQQKSQFKPVSRVAKSGDWVEISFAGKVGNITDERLKSEHHPLVIGSGAMIPGFEDAVVGMKKDEEKNIDITFPKDYHAKQFAGKPVKFNFKLHEIKEVILPELDLEFAKQFGQGDTEKLKTAIESQLKDEKKEAKQKQIESAILEETRKILEVEIPDGLVKSETDRLVNKLKESVEKQGIEFNRYLEMIKKTQDDLRKELLAQAKTNIEVGFIIGEVIKKEKIDVDDKEATKLALQKLVEYAVK